MSIMRKLVTKVAKRKAKEIEYILNNPIEVTEKKLLSVLSRHKDTVLGRKYGFDTIRTPEEYSSRVSLCDYNSMEPYLRMTYENPNGHVMTIDPVVWYLQTSGSTGTPKRLPVTADGAKDFSKGSMLTWLAFMNADPENTKLLDGALITFGAPAVLDSINGIPVGYATGALGRRTNPIFRRLMKPGEDVFNILDIDEKMRRYARLMATANVTGIQGITTLSLALVRKMQEQYGPWLLETLKGTPHEQRIGRLMYDDGRLDVQGLWPNLRLFSMMGIDCDPYREWIHKTFPDTWTWEMYGASEGFFGGQLLEGRGVQLMSNLNYMEFIPENEVSSPDPTVIPLSDVKKGQRYEMIMTNNAGWYRYRLGDMMTFTSTDPYTVVGIGRKGRIVNMSGEKISDRHVAKAIEAASLKTGAQVTDYCVVGVVEDGIPHYIIALMLRDYDINPVEFVMSFEEAIMTSNEEFRIVRESGALGPTTVMRMRSSLHERVVRASHLQAKPQILTTDQQVLDMCEAY